MISDPMTGIERRLLSKQTSKAFRNNSFSLSESAYSTAEFCRLIREFYPLSGVDTERQCSSARSTFNKSTD